jgi:ribosomal protein S18 acetylase RimI-like enzyme
MVEGTKSVVSEVYVSEVGQPIQYDLHIFDFDTVVARCLATIYHNGAAKIMVIDSVWVEEDYRNRGLATKLILQATKIANGNNIDAIELIVNDNNQAAKNLYTKTGFKKTNKEHYRIILREK